MGVFLPESDDARTRKRLARRFPDAVEAQPSHAVATAIGQITALLSGTRWTLPIPARHGADRAVPEKVYAIARKIQPGETLTYGAIAELLGTNCWRETSAKRWARTPSRSSSPYRAVAANGKLGGFPSGGANTKLKTLGRSKAQPWVGNRGFSTSDLLLFPLTEHSRRNSSQT